jgi:hypothetical protein
MIERLRVNRSVYDRNSAGSRDNANERLETGRHGGLAFSLGSDHWFGFIRRRFEYKKNIEQQ